jgi:hypothetical protein
VATHEVFNQAPPRVDVDEFGSNTALREGVARYDAAWALDELSRVGRYVGTAEFQHDAERANRREPELRTHDRHGHRVDEVDYDESYHRIIRAAGRAQPGGQAVALGDGLAHGPHESGMLGGQPRDPGDELGGRCDHALHLHRVVDERLRRIPIARVARVEVLAITGEQRCAGHGGILVLSCGKR